MKKNKKNLLGFDLDELISESLEALFEVAADESVPNMKEKLRQADKKSKADARAKKLSDKKKGISGNEGEEESSSKKPVQIKHEKVPDIDEQAIADKINSIRSGKSLKDKETMNALSAYFKKLNGPERIALFAFLSGLEKVLADLSTDVKTPHSKPFNIDMEKEEEVTKSAKPKGSKEPSKTETSENPIIVGESQDKRNILSVMKSRRRNQ